MCRLRRLKSFFCLAAFHVPSSPHQHLSHSHWNKCPRYARPKQFQNSAFSWWFQAWGNFFQSSLLLKVCICTMTYNVYVAFLGSSRSRRTRRRTQAMMQFSMPDLDASSAHSAICLKINPNEFNFDEKVSFNFSNFEGILGHFAEFWFLDAFW